ncbi:MAG: dihydropteroate synthase [Deferribacteres bacterium]|nr:dihydropteroate synthase [candidate division KSB1 bacterium]MCB9503919.1 dihydropteroate synthase [Deferribacteres bacterium]
MVNDHYMFQFGGPTRVMGILNVTPDSFSERENNMDERAAIDKGIAMEADGADIIDVGGESTRPGAVQVTEAEELKRVIPVIEGLASDVRIPLSIDTYKAPVAEAAIQAGATIVNDISGMQFDPGMAEVVKHYTVPIVIMHIKGRPHEMQVNPTYENLMDETYMYFEDRITAAVEAGISRELIIIDPGIGFGKRLWDNYEILQRLQEFRGLGCPVLVGPSRKSFIGKALDLPVEERLEGTAAAVTAAVLAGSHIVRVHDVKEMLRVVQIADLIAANVQIRQQE